MGSLSPEGGQGGQHGKAEGGAGGDGGGGGREGNLGQPHPVLLHRPRLLRRARQHLEVPLPLPEERWRSVHHPLPGDAVGGGGALAPPRACTWTKAEGWSCQGLVQGAPGPWWNWLWFNSGCRPRWMLLQRHHCLVHILPLVIHEYVSALVKLPYWS